MMRAVIVFDYDGTLVDTFAAKQAAYARAVAEALGLDETSLPLLEDSYARTSGANRFTQLAQTATELGRAVTEAERHAFSQLFSTYNAQMADRMPEFPSARRVLATLGDRYDLVLTSGMPHDVLIQDVTRRHLAAYFVHIEGGDKGQALDRLLAEGRRVAMFVGDTAYDETVAGERGVPFYRIERDADLARLLEVLL
jgi:phosphoglycolate phosphatase-like HAD superfamily hydrolase